MNEDKKTTKALRTEHTNVAFLLPNLDDKYNPRLLNKQFITEETGNNMLAVAMVRVGLSCSL